MDAKIAEQFMLKLIEKSKEYGFEEAEASFMNSTSMSVDILDGEVSSYERSSDQGVSFRGKINGQMGTASTTEFDDDALEFLLKSALENIEVLNDEDEHFIYCDPDNSNLRYEALSPDYYKNTYNKFVNNQNLPSTNNSYIQKNDIKNDIIGNAKEASENDGGNEDESDEKNI